MPRRLSSDSTSFPLVGVVRRARRIARVSQRRMATEARLSASYVARVETGELRPSLEALERLLEVAGLRLVAVDREGHRVEPMGDIGGIHDSVGRRFPTHLDLILDPRPGEWWGDRYGLARPPETFHIDDELRQVQRLYSRWVTRPKRYRGEPPPISPDWLLRIRELSRRRGPSRPADGKA